MSIVNSIETVRDWLTAEVCPLVKLKLPDDNATDASYPYKLVNPAAFSLFVPSKDRTPPNIAAPIPSVCVQIVQGDDDLLQSARDIKIRLCFSAWDPGYHGPDIFKPKGDGSGTYIQQYNEAAASEPGRVVTNGMSHYARSGENINGGMLVGVTPEDFGTDHPLAGVAWQRQLEAAAFRLGGGGFLAPCQRVEDFLAHRPSTGPGAVLPSYRPGVTWCDLHDCLPPFLTGAMEEALPLLERKLRGYAQPDALLTAVETRSSSPVRILRDESGQSALRGLYPCGEGAGYAGGILSAAADGMRCAEKIWEVYS